MIAYELHFQPVLKFFSFEMEKYITHQLLICFPSIIFLRNLSTKIIWLLNKNFVYYFRLIPAAAMFKTNSLEFSAYSPLPKICKREGYFYLIMLILHVCCSFECLRPKHICDNFNRHMSNSCSKEQVHDPGGPGNSTFASTLISRMESFLTKFWRLISHTDSYMS